MTANRPVQFKVVDEEGKILATHSCKVCFIKTFEKFKLGFERQTRTKPEDPIYEFISIEFP